MPDVRQSRQPAAHPLVIMSADFVMSRQMLRGVKTRAERTTAADLHAAAIARHGNRAGMTGR